MTIRELKQILNSTTEWDDNIACAAVVIDGMGSTTPITKVVIDCGAIYIGNDPEGCDYAATTKKDYYGKDYIKYLVNGELLNGDGYHEEGFDNLEDAKACFRNNPSPIKRIYDENDKLVVLKICDQVEIDLIGITAD